MLKNISLEKAIDILYKEEIERKIIEVPILEAMDHVLAEDIVSEINIPNFDKSPLDGYALRSEDIVDASAENPVSLEVIDSITAGYVSSKALGKNQAIRTMTGAKIPEGADVIIRYEITDFTDREVKIYNYLPANSNIVKTGEDIEKGDLVLEKGKVLGAADIGILASIGIPKISVIKKPRVGVLATGDELVDVNEDIADGRIRNSNSYMIASALKKLGAEPVMLGISKDDIESISGHIEENIDELDMFLTTGGVSVGDADLVKEAYAKLGGDVLFWRVNLKPGTPIAAAKYKGKFLFGLSGNPAAAYMTFQLIVRPMIDRLRGIEEYKVSRVKSILKNDFTKISGQNRYVRGRTYSEDGRLYTELPDKHSSGVLSSLSGTNSLFLVASNTGPYKTGQEVEVELVGDLEVGR